MKDNRPGDDSYIAWDGRRYDGRPPTDWYLAVDNRWWPSPELLGDRSPGTESVPDFIADSAPDDIANTSAPEPQPPRRGDPDSPPPASWAPTANPGHGLEPRSGTPRSPGIWARPERPRTYRKTTGRRRFPRIIIAFIAIALIRQCGSTSDSDNQPVPAPPTTITPTLPTSGNP